MSFAACVTAAPHVVTVGRSVCDIAAGEATFASNFFEVEGVRGAVCVRARSATAAMISVPVSSAVT